MSNANRNLRLNVGHVGVDEAGRGPLAGPVVAAAVCFAEGSIPTGIDDSKKLTAPKRERLASLIKEAATDWSIAVVDAAIIDEINILNATMRAMGEAVAGLSAAPTQILIDGNRAPDFERIAPLAEIVTWVGGDAENVSIAAASILAKTHRDALMIDYAERWPEYQFARHKGYPTALHIEALHAHGPCPIHRHSFAPVRKAARQIGRC